VVIKRIITNNMFTDKEIELLKEFYYYCFNTRLEYEQAQGAGTSTWKCSYWTYEIMENFILGEEEYQKVNKPPWLTYMPTYRDHTSMLNYGRNKRLMFKRLKEIEKLVDNLLVCEIGYGVDLILAMMIKKWGMILSYDQNKYFKEFLYGFFVEKKGLDLTFEVQSSSAYKFDEINEPTLVISNNTHIGIGDPSNRIRNNENLIYLRDGRFLPNVLMPQTLEECREKFGRGYL